METAGSAESWSDSILSCPPIARIMSLSCLPPVAPAEPNEPDQMWRMPGEPEEDNSEYTETCHSSSEDSPRQLHSRNILVDLRDTDCRIGRRRRGQTRDVEDIVYFVGEIMVRLQLLGRRCPEETGTRVWSRFDITTASFDWQVRYISSGIGQSTGARCCSGALCPTVLGEAGFLQSN
jgi:hypothetical protein